MSRKLVAIMVMLALMAMTGSVATAQTNMLTVKLAAQNASNQNGTATLTAKGDMTEVVLDLPAGPAGMGVEQPAHIHEGACPTPGKVTYPLTNVKDGKSTTMVNAKLADIATGKYAINVHKSAAEASVYTSCGDIQMMAMAAGAPTMLPATGGETAGLWLLVAAGLALALGGLALRRARA